MKKLAAFRSRFFVLCFNRVNSQVTSIYQKGLSAEQNLNAIRNITPYSIGGVGFDTRYEGIKGSPRLFDTLLPSFLNVKGQDYYLAAQNRYRSCPKHHIVHPSENRQVDCYFLPIW